MKSPKQNQIMFQVLDQVEGQVWNQVRAKYKIK